MHPPALLDPKNLRKIVGMYRAGIRAAHDQASKVVSWATAWPLRHVAPAQESHPINKTQLFVIAKQDGWRRLGHLEGRPKGLRKAFLKD
jgi:hypothetical protein